MKGRDLVRLMVALVWCLPSILLAVAAIGADRVRFKAVLAWARLLVVLGRRDAARQVYDAALRRTMRRAAKLARRGAR